MFFIYNHTSIALGQGRITETEIGIKEEVWSNFSSAWKLEDLENEIKEITLSDLPAEIDTILKDQQIGRIRVKI